MPDIVCRYCGEPIVCDPTVRTETSAWSAPAAPDPTACVPSAPGHAPADRPPMAVWAVYSDGTEHQTGVVPGDTVTIRRREFEERGWQPASGRRGETLKVRHELRPI